MSKSQDTSSSGTPKMSAPGTLPSPRPDVPSNSQAGGHGSVGIPGSTCEDAEPGTITIEECEFSFLMAAELVHPVAIICNTHGWKGAITHGY